ncbi:MAG TPA: circularly permuted type 2 ATP-grasp protein, partial [Orrella sp.]
MPESDNAVHPTPSIKPQGHDWLASICTAIPLAQPGHYDELHANATSMRGPWAKLFSAIGPQALVELADSAKTVQRVIAENGITYNVFVDKQDQVRPWSLSPLPMVIEPEDWQHIEAGLAQRAKLLNKIVRDVYHDRDLLASTYLPSALVLGNPSYLHAMQGVKVPDDIYLHVIAFDLARDEHGQWWVIGQRTQSPSGLGYVLENRLIVSRLFPQAYRDMRIQHLASSYQRLLGALETQARHIAHGAPRFVFLTPGPYSETYFEHAYLARYLGIPLVEGPDLTVRNDQLFLKTVHGLQRIHGLMRRLDDDFCDPLELRADSAIGIAGLLQVVRAGNVVMANALGTGFLESPAIQGFLPALSEHLLGEPLIMP